MSNIDSLMKKLWSDSENHSAKDIKMPDPIPTPSPSLNWALNGGIYPGGFYCFAGPPSGGKSFMALACVSEMLKKHKDGVVIWFDAEFSFSEHFLNIFLPDPEDAKRLIVRRATPFHGSAIFDYFNDTLRGMVKDGLHLLACVVDSVGAFIPPKEGNSDSSEKHVMGDLSSYLPKALRLILGPSKPCLRDGFEGITWIFISQVRENLAADAVYTHEKYTIPGGKAFAHFADAQIMFEKIQSKKTGAFSELQKNMNDSAIQIGHRVRAKVNKHKLGPPLRVVEFDLVYDEGVVNTPEEIAALGINLGIITKDGNTYFIDGEKIAVGEAKTIEAIADSPKIYNKIYEKIMVDSSNESIDPKILVKE